MKKPAHLAVVTGMLILLTGCSTSPGASDSLDPKAPSAAGYASLPAPGEPSNLTKGTPFGLYADPPNSDTLTALSTGAVSPDGRYRAAASAQGAWVVRIDGAWLWQIHLPEPAKKPDKDDDKSQSNKTEAQQSNESGEESKDDLTEDQRKDQKKDEADNPKEDQNKPASTAESSKVARKVVGPVLWTPRSTLLVKDDSGRWLEADPDTIQVTPLAEALKGKELLQVSPDGNEVLYYAVTPKGKQLWISRLDGSGARYLGDNATASWNESGKLVIEKKEAPPAPNDRRKRDPEEAEAADETSTDGKDDKEDKTDKASTP